MTQEECDLIVLLHNCAADYYQKHTIAKLHYSHLQKAAETLKRVIKERDDYEERVHGKDQGSGLPES